jgi:hypothetical protein
MYLMFITRSWKIVQYNFPTQTHIDLPTASSPGLFASKNKTKVSLKQSSFEVVYCLQDWSQEIQAIQN